MAANRTVMISKLHVARKQMALDEATYRALLLRVTGKDSARDMAEDDLKAVLDEMGRLGWMAQPCSTKLGWSQKPHVRKVFALWAALERAGGVRAEDGRAALRHFCQRQTGVATVEWLTPEQARNVTEALKAMLARQKGAKAAP